MKTRAQIAKDLRKKQMERNKLPKRLRGTGGKAPRKQLFGEKQLPPIKLRITKSYNSKYLGPPPPPDNLEGQSDHPNNHDDDLPPLVPNQQAVDHPDIKTEPVNSDEDFLPGSMQDNHLNSQNQMIKNDKETQTVLCTCCQACSNNALSN